MAVVVAVFAVYSIVTFFVVKGDVNMNPMIVWWCNSNIFQATDTYYSESVNDVLNVLSLTSPEDLRSVEGRYFWEQNNAIWCFGHASCKNSLANIDCTKCVTMAAGLVLEKCPSSIGAQIQLPDCRIRYEPSNFTE